MDWKIKNMFMKTMTSHERLETSLNHRQRDWACVDFGGIRIPGVRTRA